MNLVHWGIIPLAAAAFFFAKYYEIGGWGFWALIALMGLAGEMGRQVGRRDKE